MLAICPRITRFRSSLASTGSSNMSKRRTRPWSPGRAEAICPMNILLAPPRISLLSVNVGTPSHLGQHLGRPVQSGFKKAPVDSGVVRIGEINIGGDAQADLTVHGGPEKAIYAYSTDHEAD